MFFPTLLLMLSLLLLTGFMCTILVLPLMTFLPKTLTVLSLLTGSVIFSVPRHVFFICLSLLSAVRLIRSIFLFYIKFAHTSLCLLKADVVVRSLVRLLLKSACFCVPLFPSWLFTSLIILFGFVLLSGPAALPRRIRLWVILVRKRRRKSPVLRRALQLCARIGLIAVVFVIRSFRAIMLVLFAHMVAHLLRSDAHIISCSNDNDWPFQ